MRWPSPFNRSGTQEREVVEGDAEAFLRWSMDVHGNLTSFRASCSVLMNDAEVSSQTREIYFESPNRFKVVTTSSNQFIQTSVCDGYQLVEYGNKAEMPAVIATTPPSIHAASSVFMRHPMFCGSLLYQMFGGSDNFHQLVQIDKAPVEFISEEKFGGEVSRVVHFYGQGSYGNVELLIGMLSGSVYRLRYDSEPQLERMRKGLDPELRKALQKRLERLEPGPTRDSIEKIVVNGFTPQSTSDTVEIYSGIKPNAKIAPAEFSASIPQGRHVREIAS